MGYSWELTDEQKKEVEKNHAKVIEEWKKKQEGSSDTEDVEDTEQGDSRQERERTRDEDNIR